ncbi:MAG: radical SAM protein [Candidatus Glassbacteria bacterium]|nr:radical SAM protein [Candidatus Glassbacteria bacterium]
MTMKARPLQAGIIYGPIDSRRLGRSLGINILPTSKKVCTFDCLYCQYGFTTCRYESETLKQFELPGTEQVTTELGQALALAGELDAITLAGNGEPTLNPQFAGIARAVAGLRDRLKPGVPVCILSNASTLDRADVREGLKYVDRKVMKLDAGTQKLYSAINRPSAGLKIDAVAGHLAGMEGVEIQSLFFEGPLSNADEVSVASWLDLLGRIGPAAVQVYTLDRTPADNSLRPVGRSRLEEIAAAARKRLPQAEVRAY